MKSNVGTADRGFRLFVGAILIGLTLMGTIGPWGWIGVIPILTGLFRFCPAYLPFGIHTCPVDSVSPDPK